MDTFNRDYLVVKGAREHNLKGVDLTIPRGALTVFTGVSGSGKSSMAMDTLFAEGRRRYVEALSSNARQLFGGIRRPAFDRIEGLTPTLAVEGGLWSANTRSTVGTITEIHDYLRVMFARLGVQYCHLCDREVGRKEPGGLLKQVLTLSEGTRFMILSPLASEPSDDLGELLEKTRAEGYSRLRLGDGSQVDIATYMDLVEGGSTGSCKDGVPLFPVDVVIDRIVVRPGIEARITDSIETGLSKGKGRIILNFPDDGGDRLYSEYLQCPYCQVDFPETHPGSFSFNSHHGACSCCQGLGDIMTIAPEKIIPDPELCLRDGALVAPGFRSVDGDGFGALLAGLASHFGLDLDCPWSKLPPKHQQLVLAGSDGESFQVHYGSDGRRSGSMTIAWEGVVNALNRRLKETHSDYARASYQNLLKRERCEVCQGERLRPEMRAVRVFGKRLPQMEAMDVGSLYTFFGEVEPQGAMAEVAVELIREIRTRLGFLVEVGLSYLSLSRPGPTLSGGESQRLRLGAQLGGTLTGVTYVLDEPSSGLHFKDVQRLVKALRGLRDGGNTVIVVEHHSAVIEAADHVVDFGLGAGSEGGQVVVQGTVEQVCASQASITGGYLSGRVQIPGNNMKRSPGSNGYLRLLGAKANNLKDMDLEIPLGCMVAVSGVSGAGKSSLVMDTLVPALLRKLGGGQGREVGTHGALLGAEGILRCIEVDQSPIGRSPRSNAATYTKVFDSIRQVFSQLPESRAFGFKPERFSFNLKGGRCEICRGDGLVRVAMHFLPDMFIPCEGCGGTRFNDATLRVNYRGYNIAQVLELSCKEARELFSSHPRLHKMLDCLVRVGLGYLPIGQPATTLSGGEAQRIKIAKELGRAGANGGKTLYVLDEPSVGLHPQDVEKLLDVLDSLVQAGHTVLVVEHDLDILWRADHVVDLGPGGGQDGGRIVVAGTPDEVAACSSSVTGEAMAAHRSQ